LLNVSAAHCSTNFRPFNALKTVQLSRSVLNSVELSSLSFLLVQCRNRCLDHEVQELGRDSKKGLCESSLSQ
jgi:hypothetical protein